MEAQTSGDWEIIIVDDGSDEQVYDELKKFESSKIKVLKRERLPKGPSACRNLGVKNASGKYLIFLDSDDLLAPHCLKQRTEIMDRHSELSAGVFLMKQFEKEIDDTGKIFNTDLPEEKWADAFLDNINPWNVTCPIWRKDAFERTSGFDEQFLFMEDPDLHLRGLYGGEKFKTFYDNPPDCYYRVHHFDETKKDFYYNSILYRIRFYRKVTSGFYSDDFINIHKESIKRGVSRLVKTFLFSRVSQFPELYEDLMAWMKSSGIFSKREIMRYRFLVKTGNTENKILKTLRVKGICYSLLPSA